MANEGVFDCFIRLCLKIWRISKFGETQTHSLCQKALCIAFAMCFNVANLDCFLFKSKKIIKIMTQFEQITAVYNLTKLQLSLSQSLLTQEFWNMESVGSVCLEAGGSLRLKFD